SRLIDTEKRRVQSTISRMLKGVQQAAQRAVHAQQPMEEAALRAVAAAHTLDELRPSTLRTPRSAETATDQLLIAQIADRLGNLVRAEVEACFTRHFSSAEHIDQGSGASAQAGSKRPDAAHDGTVPAPHSGHPHA
ncbi:MAG: hypothetical protein ACREO8_08975, partial [Luteimonas sp.]